MERTDFLNKACKLKCDILTEIRKVLSDRMYFYSVPFVIHYIDGENAYTQTCKAIEVDKHNAITIHYQSEGYGPDDIDVVGGECVLCYSIDSLADILGNLKRELRETKLTKLRKLIKDAGGKLTFDGDFVFTGVNEKPHCATIYVEDNHLLGVYVVDNTLYFGVKWENNNYDNSERYIDFFDLDRLIEYVESNTTKTFQIMAEALVSRLFEIKAHTKEEAYEIAKQELNDDPFGIEDLEETDWSLI